MSVGRFTWGTSPSASRGRAVAPGTGRPATRGPTLYCCTPCGPAVVTRAKRGGRGPPPSR